MEDSLLLQKVEDTTRVSCILDLVLTNRGEVVEDIKMMGNLGGIDQDMIEF